MNARQRQAGDDQERNQLEDELQVTYETGATNAQGATATGEPECLRPASRW
jgi:hypothetical protein